MHISFVTPYPSSHDQHGKNTGVGSYSMYLVEALAKAGHSVDVYAHNDGILPPESLESIRVFRVWKKSLGGIFSLLSKIIRERPQVLHIQHEFNIFGKELTLPFTPLIPLIARMSGARVITTFHGGTGLSCIDHDFVKENGKKLPPWIIRLAFRYIFGLFSLSSHRIIVHEDFQKRELVEEHGIRESKISVIPHGVPEDGVNVPNAREILSIPRDKTVFLFMGFAARYKGLPELYEAYRAYRENNPDTLLIVGAGPAPRLESDNEYMDWYRDLEERFTSLGESVRWVGFIPSLDIGLYYSATDAVVFPYSRRLAASGPMALAIGYEKDIILSSILKGEKEYQFDFDDTLSTLSLKRERSWRTIVQRTCFIYEKGEEI